MVSLLLHKLDIFIILYKSNFGASKHQSLFREPTVEKSSSGGGDPVADKFTFLGEKIILLTDFNCKSEYQGLYKQMHKYVLYLLQQ